jgi:hypothetical protein
LIQDLHLLRETGALSRVIAKLCSVEILRQPGLRHPANGSAATKLLAPTVISVLSRRYELSFSLNHCATFFAKTRMVAIMLSGDECRAKARQSLDFARLTPSAKLRAEWRTMARDWLRLGLMADYQDRMQCE